MDSALLVLDFIGTSIFAITGALAAGRKQMDLFGALCLGCVTALGGGTVRDLLLVKRPVFWVVDTRYLAVAALATLCTFAVARKWHLPRRALVYADAAGLALFTVIGFRIGFGATHSNVVATVMAISTAVVGGVIRDVLSGQMPFVFRSELYASATLCGAGVLALLSRSSIPPLAGSLLSMTTTLVIRCVAIHWNLGLPIFRMRHES